MPVHAVSHIVGDMLGDPVVQITLQHPDQVTAQGDPQGKQDQKDQGLQISGDQTLVYDPSRQDGGQKLHGGGHKDRGDHQKELLPVGYQIGKNPL